MYEDWEEVRNISGHSGCVSRLVKKKGADDRLYFMKEFTGDDTLKRGRFARETLMYDTLNIPNIPKVIEHNVNEFKNKAVTLYYVCEYIAGEDLDTYLKTNKPSEEQGIDLFRQLLLIIQQVHAQEGVHRDIKPQNIIVNCEGKLFLVDFGIAHMDLKNYSFKKTEKTDELGPRFLKLPDYITGSANKRAPQSDLTMCCAIALFLLSARYPRTLLDEAGKYPHQRNEEMKAIASLRYRFYWNIIFDKAFEPNLLRRWSSAQEILTILSKMATEKDNTEDYRKLLQTQSDALDNNYFQSLSKALKLVHDPMMAALKNFIAKEAPGFSTETQSWVYNDGVEWRRGQTRAYRKPDRAQVIFDVWSDLNGGQIVGSISIDEGEKIEMARVAFGNELSESDNVLLTEQLVKHVLPALAALAKR